MAITVTETAAREIQSIIDKQKLDPEKILLRLGVKGGGCSGFSYLLDLTEKQRPTDEIWEHINDNKTANTCSKARCGLRTVLS